MSHPVDTTAWIAFFAGVAALAAAVGELRAPGGWAALVGELAISPALRLFAGLGTLALGAALFLGSPWRSGDALAIALNIAGGLLVALGMLILAAGERLLPAADHRRPHRSGPPAGLAAIAGAAFLFAALGRLHLT